MNNLFMKGFAFLVFIVASLSASFSVNAESTIYFFLDKEIGNPEVSSVSINGEVTADMLGPEKKRYEPDGVNFNIPMVFYHGCYRKFIYKGEGKVLIQYNYTYRHPKNLSTADQAAEIQINVQDGDVHYLELQRKGLTSVQIKEIKEKDALKKMKKKHCYELKEIVVEGE